MSPVIGADEASGPNPEPRRACIHPGIHLDISSWSRSSTPQTEDLTLLVRAHYIKTIWPPGGWRDEPLAVVGTARARGELWMLLSNRGFM